jgi:hypothetical protein
LVLWAVVAPETADAARQRFLRVVRQAVDRLTTLGRPIGIAEFETRLAEALDQLQGHLRPDQPADIANLAAGSRLLGAGYALLRQRERNDAALSAAVANIAVSDDYVDDLLEWGRTPVFAEPNHRVSSHTA